jgi:hypothetical protein
MIASIATLGLVACGKELGAVGGGHAGAVILFSRCALIALRPLIVTTAQPSIETSIGLSTDTDNVADFDAAFSLTSNAYSDADDLVAYHDGVWGLTLCDKDIRQWCFT